MPTLHPRLILFSAVVFISAFIPVFISAFILAIIFGISHDVLAQESVGVRMQPTLIEERVDPGGSLSGTITITNINSTAQSFSLTTRNVEDVDAGGQPSFSEDTQGDGMTLADWIKVSQAELYLGPAESTTVSYTVTVPESASPGGHFGGIFIDRAADPMLEQGAGIGFQVGSLMSIQVNGEITEDVQIHEFSTSKTLYTIPTVDFTVRVINNGTILERPRGVITVSDMLGNEVGTILINESAGAVLPGVDRIYEAQWVGEGFHIGRYDAIVTLSYGDQVSNSISREVSFWIVPMKELAMVLGGILAVLVIAYLLVRSYVRRQLSKAGYSQNRAKRATGSTTFAAKISKVLIALVVVVILGLMVIVLFFS